VTPHADTPPITYEIDPDAEPGDLVGALARLLVEVAEAEDGEMRHAVSRETLT